MQLDPGESWTLDIPAGTGPGRVWPRTGCSFDGAGKGSCQTGDCGGVLNCTSSGQPPQTAAEFSLKASKETDYFDISLVDGFNVPMDFLPVPANSQGGQGCNRGPRCTANITQGRILPCATCAGLQNDWYGPDITSQCPSQLKAPGGCNSACTVFNQDKYCCSGSAGKTCEPTTYSVFFIRMCPDAYSYSRDDSSSTAFTCPSGTNYQIVFCPPTDISASPPATNPPTPIATGPTSTNSSSFARSRNFHVILGSAGSLIVLVVFEGDEEFGELPGMPIRFTFKQLEEATEQFREKLGEGGFGSVFEGKYGEERIAVKRLDRAGQGKREFLAEAQTIGSIHHINLVRLIGLCAEKSHRLLVYEYMTRGSLDKWIYHRNENSAPPLDWQTRHKIITHIAKGLSYLHEECMKRIAHLDVKPQNILLDENFNAKLSDFGLCKLIDRDKSQVITRMRGTPGYLAPEWLTSQITEKADVYSFGVVVMEIISGRKKGERTLTLHNLKRASILLPYWNKSDCKRRPQMSEVVKVLEGNMNEETNIDHNFVATSQTMFGIAENIGSSGRPLASDLSGPR
ncbi:hypothetical protein ACP70R_030322 [Stipagrostis hirtigluma subsp. patula]